MNSIEIIALILISIAVIKIILLLYKPEMWFGIVGKIYLLPQLISLVALASSLIVLYFLVNSGISIVEILAVCFFIALLMVMALANYAHELLVWLKQQDAGELVKRTWMYMVVWLFLLTWGVKELFFN